MILFTGKPELVSEAGVLATLVDLANEKWDSSADTGLFLVHLISFCGRTSGELG